MIVISNHVKTIGMNYPENSIVRINVAWVKDKEELQKILQELKGHKIWLDYPTGRTKPPMPKFSLDETVQFTKEHDVEYFAFSNAESPEHVKEIRQKVPEKITLVPKIETRKGINNLKEIINAARTNVIMLDKEDLYTDVTADQEEFDKLINHCRNHCEELRVKCLELKGVIFSH